MTQHKIHAVVFKRGKWWVAVCLEHHLATQAKTLVDMDQDLRRVLVGHMLASIENDAEPFQELRPAPQRYWDMYEKAEPLPLAVPEAAMSTEGLSEPPPPVELHLAA